MEIKKIALCKGINLYLLPESKFKNFIMGVFINTKLSSDTASMNALLPEVLASGTEKYKSKKEINLRLDELYGAKLNTGVSKKGEAHVISLSIDSIAGMFTSEGTVEDDSADLLEEILLNPLKTDNGFSPEIVNREKETLKNTIESMINDKRRYAQLRCVEEMCSGEPYGVCQYGRIEDVDKINEKNLYAHYQSILKNSPIDFIAAGSVNHEKIISLIDSIAQKLGGRDAEYADTKTEHEILKVNYVNEPADVLQGKLVLGFRTNVLPYDDEYYTLMVYNGIFGGSPASKMFNNVREKMSLCYYASSGLEREKGIMLAQAGIDFENYQKTLDAIIKQHEDIKNGNFTDEEFENSKAAIINALLSYKDDISLLTLYYSSKFGSGDITGIDEACEKIKNVKKEQIVPVAEKIKLDTVYFLSGKAVEDKI